MIYRSEFLRRKSVYDAAMVCLWLGCVAVFAPVIFAFIGMMKSEGFIMACVLATFACIAGGFAFRQQYGLTCASCGASLVGKHTTGTTVATGRCRSCGRRVLLNDPGDE